LKATGLPDSISNSAVVVSIGDRLHAPRRASYASVMHDAAAAVEVTHPEKVLFPADGITKGELCAYYQAVAPLIVPHLAGRPVTMERFPAGIGAKGFIQKNLSKGIPPWLETVEVDRREKEGSVRYPVIGDARGLVWLANQNSITPHVWTSRVPRLEHPDVCVIDLDPPDADGPPLARAVLCVRDLLVELGVMPFVKTSGSKGFHVMVPLDGQADFPTVWRFAHGLGAVLVRRHPDFFTQEFIKADRGGRIYLDTARNAPGATFAAAYAVRPKPGAPVSAPCTWSEIESGAATPRAFTLRNLPERLAATTDPWAEMAGRAISAREPLARLEETLRPEDWNEALAASTRRPVSRRRPPRTPSSRAKRGES
jgi:bifunctional non-homologous end joining protein LigD